MAHALEQFLSLARSKGFEPRPFILSVRDRHRYQASIATMMRICETNPEILFYTTDLGTCCILGRKNGFGKERIGFVHAKRQVTYTITPYEDVERFQTWLSNIHVCRDDECCVCFEPMDATMTYFGDSCDQCSAVVCAACIGDMSGVAMSQKSDVCCPACRRVLIEGYFDSDDDDDDVEV